MNQIITGNICFSYINPQKLTDLLQEYKESCISNNPGCTPRPYIICGPETYNQIGTMDFSKYHAKVLIDYTLPFGEIEIR